MTLATLWQSEYEREALRQLEQEGVTVISAPLSKARAIYNDLCALIGPTPLQAAHCWQPTLMKGLRTRVCESQEELGAGFDVIHVEHLRGVRYALELRAGTPIVWDSVDCISHLFGQATRHSSSRLTRWMTGFELPRTQRYEGWLARQFARVLVTSETDRSALERLARHEPFESTAQPGPQPRDHKSIAVLPNGANLEYFKPDDSIRRTDILVFSGKMSYHANVAAVLYFAHEVLPLIWQERPQVQLWIVGQSPPASVRALAADPRITVTGYVPDMRPYISQATVAVCPLVYGAGIQNKVLEAMASGIPVVTGSVGASALKARAGEEMLVAEGSEEFARCVLQLLGNAEFAHRVGFAGRRFVEQHHDWTQIGMQLEAYYQESIETWNTYQPQTQK